MQPGGKYTQPTKKKKKLAVFVDQFQRIHGSGIVSEDSKRLENAAIIVNSITPSDTERVARVFSTSTVQLLLQ